MSEKRRLGRGLGALIPDVTEGEADVREMRLDRIRPNPFQPRVNFDPKKLNELAESIKEHGVVQAVVLSPDEGDGYFLVAGERRYRASQMAGLTKIPAVVREFNKSTMLEIALIENLQREDLSPIEEANAYRRLMEEFDFTQEELARRIGKSRSAIANTVRLLSLPETVKQALARGEISAGQARPILGIQDPASQEELAQKIIAGGITAREAERLAQKINEGKAGDDRKPPTTQQDPLLVELQTSMQRHLGTKVRIGTTRSGGGTIEIHFYGEEDLERLVSLLLPAGSV